MRLMLPEHHQVVRRYWNLPFIVVYFAVWLTACNNACFVFTSNPPNGSIKIKLSDLSPTCRLDKANSAVRVRLSTEPMCASCAASDVQHIFLGIQGIAVHPNPIADAASAEWEELLPPRLVDEPLQIDLVRGANGESAQKRFWPSVAIPAGTYSQVRLRFAPSQPASERGQCGGGRFNCVVTADGRTQPLVFDGDPADPLELRITSYRIEGGSFLIPPDAETDLDIDMTLAWEFSFTDEGMRLVPKITGNAKVRRTNE